MRLRSCRIENFGNLQHVSVDFRDGLNVFCRENGWGKSTLAAFIRAMLYGFEGENKRNQIENERRRYQPWQGGVYGGSLVIEVNGKEYEITRIFGDKKANDVFELRDARTNLPSTDYSELIGEELFGLNRESFAGSVFMGQQECLAPVTDGIHAKIGQLEEVSHDMDHYDEATKALQAKLNEMSPQRKTGSLYKLREQLSGQHKRIADRSNLQEGLAKYEQLIMDSSEQVQQLEAQRIRLDAQQQTLSTKQDQRMLQEQYRMLCQQEAQCEQDLKGENVVFAELPVDENEWADMMQLWNERKSFRKENERLREQLMRVEAMEEDDEDESPRKKRNGVLALGELLLVVGIFICFKQNMVTGIAVMIAGAAVMVLSAFTNKHRTYEEPDSEREDVQEAIALNRQRMSDLEDEIADYLNQYDVEFNEMTAGSDLQKLWMRYTQYQQAEKQWKQLHQQRAAFEQQHEQELCGNMQQERTAFERLQEQTHPMTEQSFTQLQQQKQSIEQELRQLRSRIRGYQEQVAMLQEQMDEVEGWKAEADRMENALQKGMHQYQMIRAAKELLGEAHQQMTAKYIAPVQDRFAMYYTAVTGDEADSYRLNADLSLAKQEHGLQREIAMFSAGYQDLAGLCIRLAMVDAMYLDEKPFLILDDPFVNLDEGKMTGAQRLLRQLASEYQVIYFTCQEERARF